jgi:CubicO group peptidase (beta-lactamase class C family)
MTATTYVDDLRQVIKNRALAYDKAGGRWRLDMLIDNDRGGGGALFTTAVDLVRWNDALTAGRLGKSVSEKLHEPARLSNGRKLGYARGLMLTSNYAGSVVWHGGGAAAYRSVLTRYPEQGTAIAILCNDGESFRVSPASNGLQSRAATLRSPGSG